MQLLNVKVSHSTYRPCSSFLFKNYHRNAIAVSVKLYSDPASYIAQLEVKLGQVYYIFH